MKGAFPCRWTIDHRPCRTALLGVNCSSDVPKRKSDTFIKLLIFPEQIRRETKVNVFHNNLFLIYDRNLSMMKINTYSNVTARRAVIMTNFVQGSTHTLALTVFRFTSLHQWQYSLRKFLKLRMDNCTW